MKQIFALCISCTLVIGGLKANPTHAFGARVGMNPTSNAGFDHSLNAPKKRKSGVWNEGNMIFALGYGFPNIGKTLLDASEDQTDFKATGFGPMHFRFEYALSETWGIGLSSNFNKFGYKGSYTKSVYTGVDQQGNSVYVNKTYTEQYDWTAINFLVRFNKHWQAGSRADIFSGTGIGYNYRKVKFKSDDPNYVDEDFRNVIPIGFETTIGVRIFFTDNLAGYIEAGWAKDIIQAGLCYKL
jgi:hypothetical protein